MSKSRLIDNQFVEIVTPQAPPDNTVLIITVACLIALAIISTLYLLVHRSVKISAVQKLKAIKKQNKQAASNYRYLALEVAATLRMAFRVSNLDRLLPGSGTHDEWQQFRLRLAECCYGRKPPSPDEIDYLVSAARSWLCSLSVSKKKVD